MSLAGVCNTVDISDWTIKGISIVTLAWVFLRHGQPEKHLDQQQNNN